MLERPVIWREDEIPGGKWHVHPAGQVRAKRGATEIQRCPGFLIQPQVTLDTARFNTYLVACVCVCVCAQSCLTLCDPMECSPPGSSVHGILQARTLERVAMPSSRGSSRVRDRTCMSRVSSIATWEAPLLASHPSIYPSFPIAPGGGSRAAVC